MLAAGVANGRQEAGWLLAQVLGEQPLTAQPCSGGTPLAPAVVARFNALLARRLAGEPLQYILGEWEFMGLPFYVDERALIPRQDTELLCETALERITSRGYHSVLDLCTGSGCLAVAISRLAGAELSVTAADVSADALALAAENAALNETTVTLKGFVTVEGE